MTSTNDHKSYYEFAPLTVRSYHYHGFPNVVLLVVTDDRGLFQRIRESCPTTTTVIRVEPVSGIHTGVQAKCARMWYCSTMGSTPCMPVDIDTLVLNGTWLKQCVEAADPCKLTSNLSTDIYRFTCNANLGPGIPGKFPMPYVLGTGDVFKQFVNPWSAERFADLLTKLWPEAVCPGIDGKENTLGPYTNFSDESLMRALMSRWTNRDLLWSQRPRLCHLNRTDPARAWDSGRLDELSPHCTDPAKKDENGVPVRDGFSNFSATDLHNKQYIDCSMPRPLSDHFDKPYVLAVIPQAVGCDVETARKFLLS